MAKKTTKRNPVPPLRSKRAKPSSPEWIQSGGVHIDIGTDNKGGRTRVNPRGRKTIYGTPVTRSVKKWWIHSLPGESGFDFGWDGVTPITMKVTYAVSAPKSAAFAMLLPSRYTLHPKFQIWYKSSERTLIGSQREIINFFDWLTDHKGERKSNPVRKSRSTAQHLPASSSTWGVPSRQRKVAEFAANDRVAKVYYTSDLGEYQVKYWMGGIRQEPWDYFTDDLDDAKSTAQTALRFENPAHSPALGMSKAAYINRKSQITKKTPVKRLKKRRNYAYLMAQRGFKGAFPNPIGESEWQWLDYDVWGNAEDGYQVNQAFRTSHKVMLKDDATLPVMIKALRASGVLGSKATTKTVYRETHEDATYFYAFEDDYPLGELQRVK